jgi:hypothetical protein
MIGTLAVAALSRIALMAANPSISGIMMSISTRSISDGAARSRSTASRPLRAISTLAPSGSRTLIRAKTLRTSSSASRIFLPSSTVSRLRASFNRRCWSAGRLDSTW